MPFVVLEAGGRAGGVILSEEIDGYTIDSGPDALLVEKPDGIKLCEELGLGAELDPGDVMDTDHPSVGVGFDDDVAEGLGVAQTPLRLDVELKGAGR